MAENKNVKQFKCMNFGACAKADSGEIIEIDALETLGGIPECPHCHQHTLEEVVKKPFPTKLVAIIAAVVVAIGIVLVFVLGGSGKKTTPTSSGGGEVATVDSDSIRKAQADALKAKEDSAKKAQEVMKEDPKPEKPEPPVKREPTSYNLGWGRYEGPMSGGKPNGFGGSITITSRHTIDLKKASGETVDVGPGDKITSVKMENGRLRQGEIHFADGTRKFVSGL